MNPELIKALASFWPIVLMLFLSFWGWYFRKPLKSFFEKMTNVQLKRGQTELLLSQGDKQQREIVLEAPITEEAAGEKPPENIEKKEALMLEPKTRGNLTEKLFDAYFSRDLEKLKQTYEEMQETALDSKQKQQNELFYYFLCYCAGDTSALTRLEAFTKQEDNDGVRDAYYYLGLCYRDVGSYEKASQYFDLSEQLADKQETIVSRTINSADCLFALGKLDEAYARITSRIERITEPEPLSNLYKGLADLYEKKGDFELQALALEKAIEQQSNDTSLHFSAAYAYSKHETKASILSLLHYNILLSFTPNHSAALNNLGVQYELLGLSIRSVEHYRKAEALNHTLSSANLAYKLMNAGFIDEASKILDNAKQQPEIHPNVGSALAALSQKEETESKTEQRRLETARRQHRFLLLFADAYFIGKPNVWQYGDDWQFRASTVWQFGDDWQFKTGTEITIAQTDNLISSQWTESDKDYKLHGSITNQAAQITIEQGKYYSTTRSGYAYLSSDGQEMHIMLLDEQKSSFIDLKRLFNQS